VRPFQGQPLQKPTEVQWDMRAWLHADGGANESMSRQLGISDCTAPWQIVIPFPATRHSDWLPSKAHGKTCNASVVDSHRSSDLVFFTFLRPAEVICFDGGSAIGAGVDERQRDYLQLDCDYLFT
jgi:hypothetical protein